MMTSIIIISLPALIIALFLPELAVPLLERFVPIPIFYTIHYWLEKKIIRDLDYYFQKGLNSSMEKAKKTFEEAGRKLDEFVNDIRNCCGEAFPRDLLSDVLNSLANPGTFGIRDLIKRRDEIYQFLVTASDALISTFVSSLPILIGNRSKLSISQSIISLILLISLLCVMLRACKYLGLIRICGKDLNEYKRMEKSLDLIVTMAVWNLILACYSNMYLLIYNVCVQPRINQLYFIVQYLLKPVALYWLGLAFIFIFLLSLSKVSIVKEEYA